MWDENFNNNDFFQLNSKKSSQKSSQKLSNSHPIGYREEQKSVVYMDNPIFSDIKAKYRICYIKNDDYPSQNSEVLKIEISQDFKNLARHLKKILEYKKYKRIKVFIKYKELLNIDKDLEKINNDLRTNNYKIIFSFMPKKYEDEEYVLLYDIEAIKKGEHYG